MNVRLYCTMCRQESMFFPLQALADPDAFDSAMQLYGWRVFVRILATPGAYAVCKVCTPKVLERISGGGSV